VYGGVGLEQRQPMHLRIAEALRARGSLGAEEELYEALAYHYGAADQAADAAHYAELAGNKAMSASALDRAQAQYRAALSAVDRLPRSDVNDLRWIALAERLGLASVFDPSREPLPVLQRAVERATARNDQGAIARAEYWLGYINYGLGESRAAIHHCERALTAARHVSDDRLIVQIRATLGQALAAACEYDRAIRLLDEAIAIKRRHRSGAKPAVGLCYTLTSKASVLADRGSFAQAYDCFDEAFEMIKGSEHEVEASLISWRAAVYLWQGRWQDARQCALRAQEVAERVRSLYLFSMCRVLIAYSDWVTTRDEACVQTMVDSTSWLERRERQHYISLNYGWLSEAMEATGRISEARAAAARAFMRARKHDRLGLPIACRALARAAARVGDHGSARHYLALAMQVAGARQSRHEEAVTQLCDAELAASRGDGIAAKLLLEQAIKAFDHMAMQWHLERAVQLLRTL
jgi:tetratricopeptide (TPR) repeat protein